MQKFTGITSDSREVKKGYVFVAVKGLTVDGHDYIDTAIKKGAVKVYGERDIKNPKYEKVPDSREKLGELSSQFYGNPSNKLKVIGVTGTKGKTTTCHIIHHILISLGKKAGLISTITSPGFHVTTPDVVSLNRSLKEIADKGYEYAVIEVSSHGIDQGRVAGVRFDIAALTNIAPEHLDYHKTFAEYKRTKLSFLKSAKTAVIGKKETDLDILPGKFNNLDAQLAIDVVIKLGFDGKEAIKALRSFGLPSGHLEKIDLGQPFDVYIDFAHTPESLEAVLKYLKGITKGKLISVFGCAGDRDPGKRLKMGKISSQIANLSVFTAEDPRSEDIFSILQSMQKEAKNYVSIPERSEAIAYALEKAKKGDTVGIFGKGHEKSLAYGRFEHPWSDQDIARTLSEGKDDISVIILAAGKGTRMKSREPKVLRNICGRPMIAYTLENLRKVGISDVTIVVGFRKDLVMRQVGGAVKFAFQKNPKGGTADSAKTGFEKVSLDSKTLVVMNGDDSAFYKPGTIEKVLDIHKERQRKLTFVSLMKENPIGLGRVIRGENGLITKVVEEKDATEEERKIKEVNDGFYVFERSWFAQNIGKVKKGPQGEYYLVDLIKIAIDQGDRMATYTLPNDEEWQGVNTPEQLEDAQKKMEARLK
jgi:UDP-N-acetylmuramoyl-L-alanyl-D-glutamate--2,6-diaminopimelate ligase